ncbi:MAG: hypothetical protein A2Y89_06255 [Chloroflexi bacterium RBG_13_51_18]|nr:MAG: hypothetical protein A2Y89_06255 [Chloroflexi bacterium RBG_13_51_18]
MLKRIGRELWLHIPFTAAGAVVGIGAMALVTLLNTPTNVSESLFYTFHPLHIVFSALVTTAIYRKQENHKLWLVFIVGYVGSVGIATLSDAVIPYLEGKSLQIAMEFHLPFISTEAMPFIGIPEWIMINSAAIIGIVIGYFKPNTRLPHMTHVLLSTWASLFGFTAFGTADWLPLLPILFVFLFLAVWIPCCVSDIVFPLLWTGKANGHEHKYEHTH